MENSLYRNIHHDHPIIKVIVKHPSISRSELYARCGIGNKRIFLIELQTLFINEHLCLENGFYLLKKYSLSVIQKEVNIQQIELAYRTEEDLERGLQFKSVYGSHHIEDKFDFQLAISGFEITEKHRQFVESLCEDTLDCDKYKYLLSYTWSGGPHEGTEDNHLKNINIIHLEDDRAYATRFKREVKEKYFPDSNWFHFVHAQAALDYMQEKFEADQTVSLVITDMNHPGQNGYDFAKDIRTMEREYQASHAAVILVSSAALQSPQIQLGLEEHIFSKHWNKGEDWAVIGCSIKHSLLLSLTGIPNYVDEKRDFM